MKDDTYVTLFLLHIHQTSTFFVRLAKALLLSLVMTLLLKCVKLKPLLSNASELMQKWHREVGYTRVCRRFEKQAGVNPAHVTSCGSLFDEALV